MNRTSLLLVFTTFLAAPFGFSESPAASTATVDTQRPVAGLKSMKSAARNDPASIAVNLTSPEPRDRGLAAQALGRLGSSAHSVLDAVLEALTDFATYRDDQGTHIVSVEAAQALRRIDPKAPVPPKILIRITRTASASPEHQLVQGGWVSRCGAQSDALATLVALGPLAQNAVPELTRLNHKPCTEGRALEAAQAIGPLTSDQMPRLVVLLNDPDAEARRSVAEYIGEARLTGSTAALGRAMNDDASVVRLAALDALEKLHPEGEARVPLVKPFLQDPQANIRREALRLLLKLAPDASVTLSHLKDQLKDSDSSVVLESALALSRIQPRNKILTEALVRLAKGTDSDTGIQAAELLKTSGSRDPKVVEALEPYRARERERQLEKAILTSTSEERAVNARTLHVNAIRMAKGIQEEQPDHAGRVFSTADKTIFCWTAVAVNAAPAALRHVWIHEGKPVYETTLVVPEAASRVWSRMRAKPGKWRVEVTLPGSSEPLASASFTVVKK